MQRRDFLSSLVLAPALIGCTRKSGTTDFPITVEDLGREHAHALRDRQPPPLSGSKEKKKIKVVIVGGGVAGLSAAWYLDKAGFRDFQLVEMGDRLGGNARYGHNTLSAYPQGAHYLPLPPQEAVWVRELLADLGAIHGDPHAIRPVYEERLLCHTPQERLYRNGLWQEGILPQQHLNRSERDEISRFLDQMQALREARDSQGRRAFALPADLSSPEPRWRHLDRLSMHDWLEQQGYRSAPLYWYVDYACRDDFGCRSRHTSAWAGLHYFACRNGQAENAASDAVLTAPEGNGWIIKALEQRLARYLQRSGLVSQVEPIAKGVRLQVWQAQQKHVTELEAEHVIWAAPLFVLPYVTELPDRLQSAIGSGSYAPWLVANLSLREPPPPGAGASLAWDNVLYGSSGLGYVVATHQNLSQTPRFSQPTVLTWYQTLADGDPGLARRQLLETSVTRWADTIYRELGQAHGDLRPQTLALEVVRHGHAMRRPTPGSLWHQHRHTLTQPWQHIHLAHADCSGFSLFEEANYRGVQAARTVLNALSTGQTRSEI